MHNVTGELQLGRYLHRGYRISGAAYRDRATSAQVFQMTCAGRRFAVAALTIAPHLEQVSGVSVTGGLQCNGIVARYGA